MHSQQITIIILLEMTAKDSTVHEIDQQRASKINWHHDFQQEPIWGPLMTGRINRTVDEDH